MILCARQLHPAVNDIAERVIVGGDFNTNPWAWVDGLGPLAATEAIVGQEQAAVVDDYLTGNAFTGAVPVSAATMRLPAFPIRTDDLYARGLPVLAAGVEHVEGSDHGPMWSDVDVCATPSRSALTHASSSRGPRQRSIVSSVGPFDWVFTPSIALRIVNTTRRLVARPTLVLVSTTGFSSP